MNRLQQAVYTLLFVVLSTAILYLSSSFLIPVVLAGVLAMLFIQLCNALERKGLKRGVSSLIAVLLFILAVAIIIGLLSWQLTNFSENIEQMKERMLSLLQQFKNWLESTVGITDQQQRAIIKQQGDATAHSTRNMLTNFAAKTLGLGINTILVLVYIYLLLFYRSRIKQFILKLVPPKNYKETEKIISQAARVSQQYLGGLAGMIVLLWILYGIGFSVVGVENALFFAVLCGILEIIPFVGNITGTATTVLAVVAQGGKSDMIIGVIAVYLLVQFFQTYILEPLVVGNQVNINPLFTIMALTAGELIWGIAGMVLAIPVLGIIKIICDHVPSLTPYGYLIGTEPKTKHKWVQKIKNTAS
ncbi:AI-2E family transporter [Olivibacter ginsenosidimutans]|uniref:AI-2E family transporter n=1 Tax=Olivibacter ginsenosidimutans TaxID=1176537 RepID=A0ABP9BE42_9SPHI